MHAMLHTYYKLWGELYEYNQHINKTNYKTSLKKQINDNSLVFWNFSIKNQDVMSQENWMDIFRWNKTLVDRDRMS